VRVLSRLPQRRAVAEHALGAPQQAAEHAHAVAEGLAVGRIADIRLHDGPVDAQLPPARDPRGLRQRHDPVVERGDGARPDEVGPADEGGVVGHRLQVHAAELPQHQTIVDEVLGLGIAPPV